MVLYNVKDIAFILAPIFKKLQASINDKMRRFCECCDIVNLSIKLDYLASKHDTV